MKFRIPCLTVLVASGVWIGCRPAEEIQSYPVAKEVLPRKAVSPGSTAEVAPATTSAGASDRMLAAVLPEGDRAWYFKVTGPVDEVDAKLGEISAFFESIRPATGKALPDWELAADWQQQPGSGMRAATILIPVGNQPLELSVTALPWRGAPGEMLSNINRWRGQMQLAPTDKPGLANDTRQIKAGEATLTIVDLRGRLTGGMMPPFAGGTPENSTALPSATSTAPPAASSSNDLPPGHPPVSQAQRGATTATPFTFELPAGWEPLAASGMRKAAFRIADGGQQALLTVIDFPADAGPMMADPVAQAKRWRGEVGLPPLTDEEIQATIEPIEIDGTEAKYVAAVPDADQADQSQADRATLAAMLTRGNSIWFFKLSGDRKLVAAQQAKFQSFLKSVKFTAPGADDGN